jgi:phosphoglycolate phosphatase-like HAD superfamily hydrolase
MDKPIIATTFSGLFLKHEPWNKAHIIWLKTASEKLKDPTIMNWANRPDYFNCVDGIMKRLYPDLDEKQRVVKAREMFFESVCEYIEQNPNVRNETVISYFNGLKNKYRLALITTNTSSALERILEISNLSGFFDIIETSLPEERDDKRAVFERFIRKYGKPLIYIGGSRKDSFDYCRENNIPAVFANLENEEESLGVESIRSLEELKIRLLKF